MTDSSPENSPPAIAQHDDGSRFAHPPDPSWPALTELEYLTATAFLAIRNRPIPAWMNTHIADNFRSEIDNLCSSSWDEHVQKFRKLAQMRPSNGRITNMITDVDDAKAHADVFCHMESTSIPTNIKRLGMAQLKWKRHPFDGRWQLVHIIGMREPPSDLGGDLSGPAKTL